MKTYLLAALATLGLMTAAVAAPPMGMTVPLPEALPEHTYEVQVDVQGPQVLQAPEAEQRLGLQFGLEDGWELGVDVRLGAARNDWPSPSYRDYELQYNVGAEGFENLWFNVKKQLLREQTSRPALTAGLLNLAAAGPTGKYLIAGKHFGEFQITLGWADVFAHDFYTQTLSYQPDEDWLWMFEHITGGRFSTNFGVKHPLSKDLVLTTGWMRANNQFYSSQWMVDLTYCGRW